MVTTEAVSLSKRSLLSQVLACSGQNLLLLDLGMSISFSTILIGSLLGAEGPLSFTDKEASWFGSVNFVLQPIGSILSGFILEPLGRKKAMLVVNIPHIIAWLMIYFSQSTTTLFVANALLGFGTGFMEAPTITYVGEISHPSVRGILVSYSQVCTNLGIFVSYLLGTVLDWRTAAACFVIIPLLTFIAISLVPESPVWLLSRGRIDDARKAMCWIRGWAKPEDVEQEFAELILYQKESAKCQLCDNGTKTQVPEENCPHKGISCWGKTCDYYKCMTRKEMRRPLTVMFLLFLFHQLTALTAIKPNQINVYNTYGINIDGHLATVITGAIGLIGTVVMMMIVHIFGKRRLTLTSLVIMSACLICLGSFAYVVLPVGSSSYHPGKTDIGNYSWIPTVLFATLNISGFLGINIIPWMMLAELYPLRGRGLACGITAAYCYILSSIVSKTYYDLEVNLGMHGAMWFYACCSIIGFFTLYVLLPETEGKPFTEIEAKFAGDHMPIFANDPLTRCLKRKLHVDDEQEQDEKIVTKF